MTGWRLTGAAMLASLGAAAGAQDAAPAELPGGCAVRDASRIVSVVICPAALDQTGIVAAARAACADRAVCGAWVWTDAEAAPAAAPENHDGLTEAEVTSALGVWVAEQQSFIAIDAGD